MKRFFVFLLILVSMANSLVAQTSPATTAVEKVSITIDGENYSKAIPNTIPELKKLVRDFADIINDQAGKAALERDELTKQLNDATGRTNEILESINKMDEANKKLADGIGEIETVKASLADLSAQLKKDPYKLIFGIQPGVIIGPTGIGFGGGPVVSMSLFDFALIGGHAHLYNNGSVVFGVSLGMTF